MSEFSANSLSFGELRAEVKSVNVAETDAQRHKEEYLQIKDRVVAAQQAKATEMGRLETLLWSLKSSLWLLDEQLMSHDYLPSINLACIQQLNAMKDHVDKQLVAQTAVVSWAKDQRSLFEEQAKLAADKEVESAGDFKLSATLRGHEQDLRTRVVAAATAKLSEGRCCGLSQRANTLLCLRRQHDSQVDPHLLQATLYDDTIALQGSNWFNGLAYAPPSQTHPDGLVAGGGREMFVKQVGRPPEEDPHRLLIGHAGNMTCLAFSEDGSKVISGGWDSQAFVWDIEGGNVVAELQGHEGPVWGVMVYDAKLVLTACADKMIRVFDLNGKSLHTIKGHTDVVRCSCKLPPGHWSGAAFASAGNDEVIRLWTLEGTAMGELDGHTAYIYSLAMLPNGDIVGSSEDRTVRIWRDGKSIQTITHPTISIWTVAACEETGDIVSGASDNIIRIFSRDPERQADPESIKSFEVSNRMYAIPAETASQDLPIEVEIHRVRSFDTNLVTAVPLALRISSVSFPRAATRIFWRLLETQQIAKDSALDDQEKKVLYELVDQINNSPRDPHPSEEQVDALIEVATQWPTLSRVPGVALLARLAIAPSFVHISTTGEKETITKVLAAGGLFIPEQMTANNAVHALRLFVNLFATEAGRFIMDGNFDLALNLARPFASHPESLAQFKALVMLYLNYSVLLTSQALPIDSQNREARAGVLLTDIGAALETESPLS